MFDLKGKTVVVTGAARGIGRGIALAMASAGADVVVSDLTLPECEQVVQEIKSRGKRALAVKTDVSRKQEVEALVNSTVKEFGKLDVMVNNAGIYPMKPFLELDEALLDKVLAVNVKGVMFGMQAAAKQFVAQKKGGRIINVSSIAAQKGYQALAHYCATKGAVSAATRAVALELAPYKINVNAIAPGVIETPGVEKGIDENTRKQLALGIPVGRIGKPEDIAALAVFLASDESSFMTGTVVVSDGGQTA